MSLDQEQLALVILGIRLPQETLDQLRNNVGDDFGVILDLESEYALVSGRRVTDNVRKITIHRNQDGIQALSLSYNLFVYGVDGKVIPESMY